MTPREHMTRWWGRTFDRDVPTLESYVKRVEGRCRMLHGDDCLPVNPSLEQVYVIAKKDIDSGN